MQNVNTSIRIEEAETIKPTRKDTLAWHNNDATRTF